ncbi:MAG TPA: ABC transporter permease [Thermoanaerobacterales bacterium]|nr:ABC transporter permease [Thermoanaerobacterales bacterium]
MKFDWNRVLEVLQENKTTLNVKSLLLQHLKLVSISLAIAILIALPIGIILTRPKYRQHVPKIMGVLNITQGIPSLAIVAIFLPIMGIGTLPSIVALSLYALLPVVRNTIAGLEAIDSSIVEAARGMGMPPLKVLWEIELPLAAPILISGIQTAAVVTVGTATIADLIGGGGLGRLIFTGLSFFEPELIFLGSTLAAIIAIIFDQLFSIVNKLLSTPNME